MTQWIIFLILLLIILYIISIYYRKSKLKKLVAVLGITNSGKTRFCFQLKYNTTPSTLTTLTPTYYELDKDITLIDIPQSHDSLGLLKKCRKVVFMIDGVRFSKELDSVAAYLYLVLCQALPVLLVIASTDKSSLKESIQLQLENEIEKIRSSGSNTLDDNFIYLGLEDKKFEFCDLESLVDVLVLEQQRDDVYDFVTNKN